MWEQRGISSKVQTNQAPKAGDLLLLMLLRHRLSSLTLELLSTPLETLDFIRLCHFCRDPLVQLGLGQGYVESLKASLLKSVECSSMMLTTFNFRGIRGHTVLHELLSTLQNSLLILVPASIYPSSPVSGAGCKTACWEGTEISLLAFGSLFAENPIWRRTLPTRITQILICNIQR